MEFVLKRTLFAKLYAAAAFIMLAAFGFICKDRIFYLFAGIVLFLLLFMLFRGDTIVKCLDKEMVVINYLWKFSKNPTITVIQYDLISNIKMTATQYGRINTVVYENNKQISFREDENEEFAKYLENIKNVKTKLQK
ncbi:hypothetical protein IJ843_00360 [bacterium]|nr:hypothetical protein [bacterium]